MQFTIITLSFLGSLAYAFAIPKNVFDINKLSCRADGRNAVTSLLEIAPLSKSCDGAEFKDECATSEQAAPFLIQAFQDFQITNPNEIAAVLGLIALESGQFKYNINHFPGNPGQGTRNMQGPDFNLDFARSFPNLKAKADAITTAPTTAGLSKDQLNAVRALVLPDMYSWASAAWFLTTKCADARPAIQKGGDEGLEAYMACVGTTITPERAEFNTKAAKAIMG
ncbi:hypothetical protein BJ875DRAFT_112274 [Amylocarpus encephaloides]|uniref:Uncharacterized protein n=1 Tax=Amylocarpus encephaloides TaxID=45428 RepID=A0A9P7YEG9_9HELO|nr:hypothetical protein BJ875DRAFT_112274 [Amylocarpus encephaloides]